MLDSHREGLQSCIDHRLHSSSIEFSDDLPCLVSSEINHGDGVYTTEIPEREVELGELEPAGFDLASSFGGNSQSCSVSEWVCPH